MWNIKKHCKALELDKVLEMLAETASCEESREKALLLTPQTDLVKVQEEMNKTASAHSLLQRYGAPAVYQLHNCAAPLNRARAGAAISPKDLLGIAQILRNAKSLADWRKRCDEDTTPIDEAFEELQPNKALEERISSTFVSEEEVADYASPALADIRRKIRGHEQKIRTQLDHMIHSAAYQKYLQDQIITIRDGRFVIPVRAEYRGEVKGLVHATSSSGSTLFIEPLSIVEANNEIRVLEAKEETEIQRIILELSNLVGENSAGIMDSYGAIIALDLVFSKARLADTMRAVAPELNGEGKIELKKVRHPLISKEKIVPIDIRLGQEFDTLVITGPNTGGKTVALKTLGLFTLMAMCGLMIPANYGSQLSVFNKVLADIGDEQSIEQSLSTFSAHMTNIIRIFEETDDRTLVLLDELGAGTDPVEGAALAISIIEQLRMRQAKIGATTHYAEMKVFALQTDGVENACCEFDVQTLQPTYKLLIGIPGRSNAFAITERLGMDREIVERAKELISSENSRFEDVVTDLERSRQELEMERKLAHQATLQAEAQRKKVQEERRRFEDSKDQEVEKARQQAQKLIEQVQEESRQLLAQLDEVLKARDQEDFTQLAMNTKVAYRTSMKKLQQLADPVTGRASSRSEYQPSRAIRRGDAVLLTQVGNKEGTVLSDPDGAGMVLVQTGIIKTRVPLAELRLAEGKNHRVAVNSRSVRNVRSDVNKAQRDASMELDVRGQTVDEALIEVDRFLDNAVLLGLKTLTVIHGKGTGALRAGIQTHLRKHPNVRTFRLGVYGEGESGVTVIELK